MRVRVRGAYLCVCVRVRGRVTWTEKVHMMRSDTQARQERTKQARRLDTSEGQDSQGGRGSPQGGETHPGRDASPEMVRHLSMLMAPPLQMTLHRAPLDLLPAADAVHVHSIPPRRHFHLFSLLSSRAQWLFFRALRATDC